MDNTIMNALIGSVLFGIKSTFVQIIRFRDGYEFYFDYSSKVTYAFNKDKKNHYRYLEIDSSWHEFENGEDNFELNLRQNKKLDKTGTLGNSEAHILNQKPPAYISFSLTDSYVQKIERYGFRFLYQERAPTKHILLFYFSNGTRMLLKPDFSGMGLFLALDEPRIQAFFDGPQKDQIILIDTFE